MKQKKYYVGTVTEKSSHTPISNVSVSDGRNVVKTDENGQFQLSGYSKTRFITMTSPSGYMTDQFYIDINQNLSSYDFTLEKSNISYGEAHSFLHISDTEVNENGVGEWKNDIIKNIQENAPAFLIHTGDICYEAGLKTHYGDMNSTNMGLPVYYSIGNHDYVDGKYGEELYESIYGPVWYSFEVGNVHYVVTPFQIGGDRPSRYHKNDRWRWLKNDLENMSPDMNLIIFNHDAPHRKPMDDNYVLKYDGEQLDLKKYRLSAWVYGHYHYHYVSENKGILEISTARPDCGGIDESPAASRLIQIGKGGHIATKLLFFAMKNSREITPQNTKWVTKVDGNAMFCNTLYNDGKIYIATADDNLPRKCGIYCLNASDGSVIWKKETENSVRNHLIIANAMVYTQDSSGNVYCLDAENGNLIWQTKVTLIPSISTEMGICMDDDTVYAGCALKITALDIHSGKIKFSKARKRGECSPASLLIKDDRLILSAHWDGLTALQKTNGKEIWKSSDKDLWHRNTTPAFIDDNTLLVAEAKAIMHIDVKDGSILHKSEFKECAFNTGSTPLIDGELAYIATANKGVMAYNINTHKLVWNADVNPSMLCTPAYVGISNTVETSVIKDGENVVFAASDGCVYKVHASDGKIVSVIHTGVPIISTVAVHDGNLYISDFKGRIMCITE